MFVTPTRSVRLKSVMGKDAKSHRVMDLSFKIDRMFNTTQGSLF